MDYAEVEALRRKHPAWRLLAADHAPLIVSFLRRAFIDTNERTLAQSELASQLEDFLYTLRRRAGEGSFPRAAADYLDEWAADDKAWLRKYYREDSDEPFFDLTPAAERALGFVSGLAERQLVSTESRLLTVFELLRQLTEGTTADADVRIAELERRRAALDAEIDKLRDGDVELMEPAQIKDRFLQMAATARALLSDFRALDQNFRELDRSVRERIATWEGSKGELLEDVFGARDAISDSDQGRSFRAFWDFLMSPVRQEELTTRLETVLALPAVRELAPDPRLLRVHYDWLEAGEVAQRTVARLSEQLRRYLDDRAFLENRRIMQLIRGVEQRALALRKSPPAGRFAALDAAAPAIVLPMERPLYSPPYKPHIGAETLLEGSSAAPTDALYEQVYVDRAALQAHIRKALQTRPQVSLAELLEARPLSLGLSELIGYLAIAAEDPEAVIDDSERQRVVWADQTGKDREATLPLIVFTRRSAHRAQP